MSSRSDCGNGSMVLFLALSLIHTKLLLYLLPTPLTGLDCAFQEENQVFAGVESAQSEKPGGVSSEMKRWGMKVLEFQGLEGRMVKETGTLVQWD